MRGEQRQSCNAAGKEACPVGPGQPLTASWGIPDPAAYEGPLVEQRWLFRRTHAELDRRIELFMQLNIESLTRLALRSRLDQIGKALAPR